MTQEERETLETATPLEFEMSDVVPVNGEFQIHLVWSTMSEIVKANRTVWHRGKQVKSIHSPSMPETRYVIFYKNGLGALVYGTEKLEVKSS